MLLAGDGVMAEKVEEGRILVGLRLASVNSAAAMPRCRAITGGAVLMFGYVKRDQDDRKELAGRMEARYIRREDIRLGLVLYVGIEEDIPT